MPSNPSSSGGGGGWLIDYGGVAEGASASGFIWAPQIVDYPSASSAMLGFDILQKDSSPNNAPPKKRIRVESCAAPGTKARREKMRRDRLNDRFTELCSVMDQGKPPKTDKFAILSDATRLLHELRNQAEKLRESNDALQVSIKNLKTEKLGLRDEKMRLKAKKEQIEQILKSTISMPQLATQPAAAAAAAAHHPASVAFYSKTVPQPNYLPMGLWQWIPPTALDTSQDHVLRPPVA